MSFVRPGDDVPSGSAFGAPQRRAPSRQELSFASFDVATIRFVRAVEALVGRREADADKWLRRAASMPYDTFEGVHPALAAGSMALHDLVHDAMEASEPDACEWLQAVDLAVNRRGEAPYLMGTLADIQQDYELLPQEQRTVTQLRSAHPARRPPFGTPPLGADDVLGRLRGLAVDAVAYGDACEELALLPSPPD